jgi:tripartite-type tricarboxylate transporter receptor subunit TctC
MIHPCTVRAAIRLALVAVLAGLSEPALAQKIDFSGQKITLAIATPPGGGYDLYARLAAASWAPMHDRQCGR